MNYFRVICSCAAISLSSISLKAQTQGLVTNNIHPIFSVSSNFLGQDYQVSNIEFTGNTIAVGQFIGDSCNLALSNGIILTTGTVLDDENGPHGPNDYGFTGIDNGSPGYWRLNTMSEVLTYNAAVLDFDFVPMVDSIGFNYVFGSDEYPQTSSSNFHDLMGIFISGPGIIGTKNLAFVPDSQIVSIQNVNQTINSNFYWNNGDGSTAPNNASPFFIQYDGFTKVLKASRTGLEIGQVYHLTFAIADAGDGIFDSGLFLESCSNCSFNVGLNDSKLSEFNLFPNPMSEVATLQLPESVSGKLAVYALSGKLISEIETDENQSSVGISGLDNGVYFVCFRNNQGEILFSERLQVLN